MLSKKEAGKLVSYIQKIKNPHEGLPQNVCLAVMKIVPFVACEVVITNEKREIFLTWRQDEWWIGWHFPGGLMRYVESFDERLAKTVEKELGVRLKKYRFLFPINYLCQKRGHVVGLAFHCITDKLPSGGKFFSKLPKDIIPGHKEFWIKAEKALEAKYTRENWVSVGRNYRK